LITPARLEIAYRMAAATSVEVPVHSCAPASQASARSGSTVAFGATP
jgi:hypothetical protein